MHRLRDYLNFPINLNVVISFLKRRRQASLLMYQEGAYNDDLREAVKSR